MTLAERIQLLRAQEQQEHAFAPAERPALCVVCNTKPPRPGRRTCSTCSQRQVERQRSAEAHTPQERVKSCLECGRTFTARGKGLVAKCCGPECARARHRRQRKAYRSEAQ